MQGLRQHVVALQTLWVIGTDRDPRFSTDAAYVDSLPETEHVRQLCYILRATPVAPPSDPGDFTQDRLEHDIPLYCSNDRRILASEARARALGISNFTLIGRLFRIGLAGSPFQRMGVAPLIGPGGAVGMREVRGRRETVATEVLGGCLPLDSMTDNLSLWGEESLPILPAAGSDLVLMPLISTWGGGAISSMECVRPSLGWNHELVNTASMGRQIQLALFTTEDEVGKQFPLNPTQCGGRYAQSNPMGGPVKRIFWQVSPRPIEKKIYTDPHGSTVYEVLTCPVDFSPDAPEAPTWPYDLTPLTPGGEFVVSAWTGLRYRNRLTFHYRGISGLIRADAGLENDFDFAPAGTNAPGIYQPSFTFPWHAPRDIGGINTEGYAYDAASMTRTALHALAPNFWPLNPPPPTDRGWILNQHTFTEQTGAPSMASPVPSGRGGIYLKSTGSTYDDLCFGLYLDMSRRDALYRASIRIQHSMINAVTDPPRDDSNYVFLAPSFAGHPKNGFLGGPFNSYLGIRAGVSEYTTFFLIGTQAEVEANMRQLYLWGY